MRKTSIWAAAVVLGALTLAGCGGSGGYGGGSSSGTTASASGSASGSAASGAPTLATANSKLGTVVVDGSGRTVYVFDKDTAGSGTSACSGGCAQMWPAVTAGSGSPGVDGVTGKVGTITRDDGTTQITLDGLPLYTSAGDSGPGDVTGQGVGGIWWVVAPDGKKIAGGQPAPGGY
jgi:predicted lipoprotein with Yx(FWY)xxD motif